MKKKAYKMSRYGLMLILAAGLITLSSCQKENVDNTAPTGIDQEEDVVPNQDAEFITKYFMGGKVQVSLQDDGTYSLAGTDTRLFENQLSDSPDTYAENPVPDEGQTNLAFGGGVRKWTDNTVYYVINGLSSSVRSELQRSIDEWESKTNVKFKERSNQSNYITISSSGSNSNSGVATLGMNGSRGFIRLGTRATAVVIIHELGHTLGYIHEQNRSDRDESIIINFENIQDNAIDQFYKSTSATLLTGQFDINSTMMYGSFTFSKNGRPTITDRNGNLLPPRQARISALDVAGTNVVYPEVDDPGDGGDDLCDTAEEWSRYRRYSVGDYVTYRGRLYQRDFTQWNFIKNC